MNTNLPQVHAQLQDPGSRYWGTIGCIGNAYGKTVANFYPSGQTPVAVATVVIPSELEKWVNQALLNKLTTLVSFDGPIAPYVNVTSVAIYN